MVVKHTYLLWLASWSGSKSKGMNYSIAENSGKPLNTIRALPDGLVPGGQGLQGFSKNIANTFKHGKHLFWGAGMGSIGEDSQTSSKDTSCCKSFMLPHGHSGMSMDTHPLQTPDWSPHCLCQKHLLLYLWLLFLVAWGTMFLKTKRTWMKGLLGRAHALQSQPNAFFWPRESWKWQNSPILSSNKLQMGFEKTTTTSRQTVYSYISKLIIGLPSQSFPNCLSKSEERGEIDSFNCLLQNMVGKIHLPVKIPLFGFYAG